MNILDVIFSPNGKTQYQIHILHIYIVYILYLLKDLNNLISSQIAENGLDDYAASEPKELQDGSTGTVVEFDDINEEVLVSEIIEFVKTDSSSLFLPTTSSLN